MVMILPIVEVTKVVIMVIIMVMVMVMVKDRIYTIAAMGVVTLEVVVVIVTRGRYWRRYVTSGKEG